jgi:2'-hydroxyisoflavone reductase
LGIGGMLDGIKAALKSDAKFTWVTEEFLTEQKVQPWSDMPVWTGKDDAVARTNISRALSKGLTFRSLDVTSRDTLAWFKSLSQERQSHLKAGLTPEREAEVLAQWHKRRG